MSKVSRYKMALFIKVDYTYTCEYVDKYELEVFVGDGDGLLRESV